MDENYQRDAGQRYGDGAGTSSEASGTAARLKEQISEKAADVKERVSDFGRRTADSKCSTCNVRPGRECSARYGRQAAGHGRVRTRSRLQRDG
jgi:hypothetical protein